MSRRRLARRLAAVEGFPDPDPDLEQYPTPPELAAAVVHEADLHGDLDRSRSADDAGADDAGSVDADRDDAAVAPAGPDVLDLGAGTGMLSVAAALRGADVLGVERDAAALRVARRNARAFGVADRVTFLRADAGRAPLADADAGTGADADAGTDADADADDADDRRAAPTVLSNPPFGAQRRSGGDRPFLRTAARVARVSRTVHNAGSRDFVESFAADHGGRVTHAARAEIDLDRRFPFHGADARTVEVEVFRIVWGEGG